MRLLYLYEIIFRIVLILLAVYHIMKKEFKVIFSIIFILAISYLSNFLNTVFQIRIDNFSNFIYLIIIFMSLYLGGSLKFYDKFKWWDRAIHFLSGAGFMGFGIAIAHLDFGIIKWIILLFGFSFSITLHVFWELLEYINDCLFHGNAQRWQKIHSSNNHVSENAIQPAGLVDTMNDNICCLVGAMLAVIVWWFVL